MALNVERSGLRGVPPRLQVVPPPILLLLPPFTPPVLLPDWGQLSPTAQSGNPSCSTPHYTESDVFDGCNPHSGIVLKSYFVGYNFGAIVVLIL